MSRRTFRTDNSK
ncbi:hypothetical protein SNEBB_001994, partial [Seison nebaliae]